MPITRLICVQGPSQLLDVMSILLYQQELKKQNYNDVLIIGGLCMSGDQKSLNATIDITKLIASHWEFSSIHNISNLESRLSYFFKIAKRFGKHSSLALLKRISRLIKNTISLEEVDQVYVCRNWQDFNEIILFTYSKARKICYGDLGHLDINDEQKRKGLINPLGFISIDQSYLVFPPESTQEKFSKHKVEVVSFDYKKKLIFNISKSSAFIELSKFCQEKLDGSILITLSNGTEAGIHNSVLEEVQLYLSIVLLNSGTGDIIWIKPHPRQTLNQAQVLCDQLKKSGRQAFCLDDFDRYPLELFIPHISSTKIICLYSYSGIISALLGYKKLVIGLDNRLVSLFVKRNLQQSFIEYRELYLSILEKSLNIQIGCSSIKELPYSPLSNSQNVVLLKEYPYLNLIQQWKNEFKIDISHYISSQSSIRMYQCMDTDLKFFSPASMTGSETLYSQLSNFSWYYLKNKWEYQVAIKTCKQFKKIIDIGCGKGEFIKLGKRYGIDILGIDMSSQLIQTPDSQDINIENISTEMAAKKYENYFEVVCCFQVLEHVAEPKRMISYLLSMLKPNGRLILSVPNAESYLKHIDSLLDMPPHHMTKWGEKTFRELEIYFPIKVEKIIKEPLMACHVAGYVAAYTVFYKKRYPFFSIFLGKPFKAIFYLLLYAGFRYLATGNSLYVQYVKI